MEFDLILLFLLIFCLLLFSAVREDLINIISFQSFQSFDGEYRIYRLQNVSERCLSAVRDETQLGLQNYNCVIRKCVWKWVIGTIFILRKDMAIFTYFM